MPKSLKCLQSGKMLPNLVTLDVLVLEYYDSIVSKSCLVHDLIVRFCC